MQVVLGLGTNLGDREGNLARALDALERLEGTELLRLSNIYETDPFDVLSQQDDYLNCCVLPDDSGGGDPSHPEAHPGDRTGHPRSEKHQNHHPHQGGG